MEQVFFRLHVRFVTTVTRLLPPQTRRALEYVTLANAFCLLLSLAWLHTQFVNPKSQGSIVSCLPAALARAGVDPAHLHVLQIHIRTPHEQMGPVNVLSPNKQQHDQHQHQQWQRDEEKTGYHTGRGATVPPDPGTYPNSGEDGGNIGGGVGSRGGGGGGASLPSESLPPEVFYSMKLVTGKDAVGTLSGPGTLGINPPGRGTMGATELPLGGVGRLDGDSVGGGIFADGCGGGERDEDKRSAVQTLFKALLWGKSEASNGKGATAGRERAWVCPGEGEDDDRSQKTTATAGTPSGFRCEEGEGKRETNTEKQSSKEAADADVDNHCSNSASTMSEGNVAATADKAAGVSIARQSWQPESVAECERNSRGAKGVSREGVGSRGTDEQGGVASGDGGIPDEVYLYSLEKGFLMLRSDLRQKHGIVTANVTISVHDPCLGGRVVQTLVKDFVGYDTVVMNWLISLYGGRGFLYGVHNNELFNLNYAAEFIESTEDIGKFLVFKIGVMFTTLFLFFTTTTLVSFTLRETQERMLKFTFLLQHHVRHRLPYAPLIFTHVVESLVFVPIMVGILFFLFEFFSDQLLAFMVLSVVWLCEVYSVVSVRTTMCIRFFPQVFFLYFTLFHVYFFSFPFGFSYLALITTVLFLQHSMLFFWNRFEVPALRAGVVSAARPRQAGMIIGVVPRYDPHGMVLPLPPLEVSQEGRQRAATVSGENPRELASPQAHIVPPILRSNSSPSPNSPRLGDDTRAIAASAATVVSSLSDRRPPPPPPSLPSPPLWDPPTAETDDITVAAHAAALRSRSGPIPSRRPAVDWPPGRGWRGDRRAAVGDVAFGAVGAGDSASDEGGGGGSGNGSVSGSERLRGFTRNISTPLLGSFPFSFWNLVQIPSATQTTVAIQAAAQTTGWQARDVGANNVSRDGGTDVTIERGSNDTGASSATNASAGSGSGGVVESTTAVANIDRRADDERGAEEARLSSAWSRRGTGRGDVDDALVAARTEMCSQTTLTSGVGGGQTADFLDHTSKAVGIICSAARDDLPVLRTSYPMAQEEEQEDNQMMGASELKSGAGRRLLRDSRDRVHASRGERGGGDNGSSDDRYSACDHSHGAREDSERLTSSIENEDDRRGWFRGSEMEATGGGGRNETVSALRRVLPPACGSIVDDDGAGGRLVIGDGHEGGQDSLNDHQDREPRVLLQRDYGRVGTERGGLSCIMADDDEKVDDAAVGGTDSKRSPYPMKTGRR